MLFEVLVRGTYLGKQWLNRLNFNSTGTPAAVSLSFGLASALGGIPDGITGEFPDDSFMALLASNQNLDVKYTELQVQALYDVEDFYVVPYAPSQAGLRSGTSMARYEAYSLRSNRVRTDIRRGFKRLVGVTEESIGAGGALSSPAIEDLQALADVLNEPLSYDDEGNTLTYTSAVLSLLEYTTPEGNVAYHKYPTLSEQLEHAALGVQWSAQANTTTQNTRKRLG